MLVWYDDQKRSIRWSVNSSSTLEMEVKFVTRTHLRPDHIGEPLVSTLIQELMKEGRLKQLSCHNMRNGTTSHFEQVLNDNAVGAAFSVHDNVPLMPLLFENVEYAFDGMSQVDCVVHGDTSFGIEIKLGTTRMASAEFSRRFCSPCGYTTHTPPRIRGSMIAVLDGRFEQDDLKHVPLKAEVVTGDAAPIAESWGLVVRRQVFSQWSNTIFPTMTRHCWAIVFEDFVDAVGGSVRFNEIVLDLVGNDFVEAWGLA